MNLKGIKISEIGSQKLMSFLDIFFETEELEKTSEYMSKRIRVRKNGLKADLTFFKRKKNEDLTVLIQDSTSNDFLRELSSYIFVFSKESKLRYLLEDKLLNILRELRMEKKRKIEHVIFSKGFDKHDKWTEQLECLFHNLGFHSQRMIEYPGQRDILICMPFDMPPYIIVGEVKLTKANRPLGSTILESVNGRVESYQEKFPDLKVFGVIFTNLEVPIINGYKDHLSFQRIKIIKECFIRKIVENQNNIHPFDIKKIFNSEKQVFLEEDFVNIFNIRSQFS